MTKALILGRKRQGRDVAGVANETASALAAAGWDVATRVVKRKRALRKRARRAVGAGLDAVVVVGGDGAVLQVIQSLADSDVALGIIPLGTGNLVAENLGIPTKASDAAATVVAGAKRRIDLGRIRAGNRDRLFAITCGIGFDAEVMRGASKPAKVRLGKLEYVASAVRHRNRLGDVEHQITVDGRTVTMAATQVFVANMGRTIAGLKPRLEIAGDDALLDVIALQAGDPVTGVLAAWDAIRQRRRGRSRSRRVLRTRGREVRVTSAEDRLVEIDGSVIGTTPVDVSIRPQALTVIVPASA